MEIEVNITKRKFFFLLGAILILIGVFAVYAYNTNFDKTTAQTPVFGHSSDEVNVLLGTGAGGVQDIRTLQSAFSDLPGQTLCELKSKEFREAGCPIGTYVYRISNFVTVGDGNAGDVYCKSFYSKTDNSASVPSCYDRAVLGGGGSYEPAEHCGGWVCGGGFCRQYYCP